jgi:hypothetical protein
MAAVQDLIDALPRLDAASTMWFARSLIGQWFKSGHLSARQWFWIGKLATETRPANVVVISLTRDCRLIAALAEQMRGLDADELAAFRAEAQSHYEPHLIGLGVSRAWAKRDVAALLDAAEDQLQTTDEPGGDVA